MMIYFFCAIPVLFPDRITHSSEILHMNRPKTMTTLMSLMHIPFLSIQMMMQIEQIIAHNNCD